MDKNFYVVAVISNPVRYRKRYELYKKFAHHIKQAGAKLMTVEVAFGDRPFEVTEPCNPFHVQLRTWDELWHKENMINIGISRLPSTWEYVAWIDADIEFVRKDWIEETVQQLQHYHFVQMFSQCIDLGPNYETMQLHNGFGWSFQKAGHCDPKRHGYGQHGFWHTGYAWAARREAIDAVGGLMDWAILGAGDHHMAMSLLGLGNRSLPGGLHPSYVNALKQWEFRASKHLKRDIGHVDGPILHYFHGKKKDRKYVERWSILSKNQFDVHTDITRDSQGLWQLCTDTPRQLRLRDEIRQYFRQRNEDSNDPE